MDVTGTSTPSGITLAAERSGAWLDAVRAGVEEELAALLHLPRESRLDPRWGYALAAVRAYALRPAKRIRPALVEAGWALARDDAAVPGAVRRFGAGIEVLHTFLLVHDDVADAAVERRGGAALHRLLAPGRAGEDLAVVVGDHLFARAVDAMLGCGARRAAAVVRYYLGVCRETAAGQYLDLALTRVPIADVSLFETLRVALLKTARYGFVAPLACGARLAGAPSGRLAALERLGRHVGLAFQLRDDLLDLFGDARLIGKQSARDVARRKPTFPVVAAYARASAPARRELDALWASPDDDAPAARVRALVDAHGGRVATERVIARASETARRTLAALPDAGGIRAALDHLVGSLAGRAA